MKTNVLLQGETRVRIPSAVKPLMSVAFITLGFMLLATVAFAVGETNGFVFTHQGRRLAYEWYIPESSILQTPEWDIDTTPCPLAPDRAWQTAKAWLTTHDRKGSTLVRIQIEPFIRQGEGHQAEKKYGRRYYYRIEVIPALFDSMLVYVLMDGTVVEPRLRGQLDEKDIK